MSDRFSLAGKTALITGGSRGLGHAKGARVRRGGRRCRHRQPQARRLRGDGARDRGAGPPRLRPGLPHRPLGRDRADGKSVCGTTSGRSTSWSTTPACPPSTRRWAKVTERNFDSGDRGQLQGSVPADLAARRAHARWLRRPAVTTTFCRSPRCASQGAASYAGAKVVLNAPTQGFLLPPSVLDRKVKTIVVGPLATDVAEHQSGLAPITNADPGWTKAGLRVVGQPNEIVGLALYLAFSTRPASPDRRDHPRVDGGPVRAKRLA